MTKRAPIAGLTWAFVLLTPWTIVSILYAQDAARPKVDLNVPDIPAATPLPSPELPDISKIDQIFNQTSLGKQADEQRLHLEWRRLANEAANDPQVIAAKTATDGLRTDFEKRQRLRAYYDLYYDRMKAKATSADMKLAIDRLRQSHLSQTAQPRVRPKTDGVMNTPTPTPRPEHHHKHGRNP